MTAFLPAGLPAAFERAARRAGSIASRGVTSVITPVVHPWMRQRPQRVRDLVTQLDGHLGRLEEARRRSEVVFETSATGADERRGSGLSEGESADRRWVSPATSATGADERRGSRLSEGESADRRRVSPATSATGADERRGSRLSEGGSAGERRVSPATSATGGNERADPHPLDDLRTALELTRDAFQALAAQLEEHVDGLDAAVARLAVSGLDHTQLRAVRREIREHTDALSRADVECRRVLESAIRLVPDGAALARLAAAGTGVVPEPADARSARAALRTAGSERAAAVLAARPALVEQLVAAGAADLDLLPAGIGESWLGPSRPAHDAAGRLKAIAGRRAHLDAAGDSAVTAALLWPAVFGPLDGAPPQARIAANRVLLRAELGRARRADVELEMRAIARRVTDGRVWWCTARAAALRAWLTRDRVTSYVTTTRVDLPGLLRADLRVRILLYQGLLYDAVAPAGLRAGDVGAPGVREEPAVAASRRAPGRRRLLLFDPAGTGRLAELWGELDEHTGAVAVFVPGTGTAVRGFHLPTQVARDLAEASPAGTAVIAWMGTEFPLAIGTHAPFARFATAAASALRDFVAGLPVPAGVPLTVLGHSYGGAMIGAAELAGLQADRIVHIASPGAGPGVRGVADYPAADPLGRPRSPARFTLTAPGDPIGWAQRFEVPWALLPKPLADRLRALVAGLSLGVDPARLDGVRILEAGTWETGGPGHRAGDPLVGPAAHAAVTARGTQAFRRLVEVVGAPL